VSFEYELGKTADIIAQDLFELKPGETLVVTADTESDERVVDAVARAAFACGAKPLVVWTAAPLGVSKAADPMLPVESLTALLKVADGRAEFKKLRLDATAHDKAMEENRRFCCPHL
jgi:leucyl aminopeptidase (aminopeptidase T)